MIKEILIILACVPLYVINSFCDKWASSVNENKHNFIYNCIKFLICSACMLPFIFIDKSPKFLWGAIVCGISCGIMYAISKTVILKGYEKTSIAFMTLCHSAGMILPCILGHFFWGEKLSIFAIFGIFFAITSIVLLKDSKSEKKKFDLLGFTLGIIIFLTRGGVMIVQKIMNVYFAEQSISAYNFYSFLIAFFIMCFFIRPKHKIEIGKKRIFLCATGSALALSIISFVMTSLAGKVPSVILFPLFNGLGIIFVCVGSIFVYKEKMTLKKYIGLAIGVIGLCLVNF